MNRHIIAYCIEADREYRLDLYRFGVREFWDSKIIWTVATREMMNAFGKGCTCWGVC